MLESDSVQPTVPLPTFPTLRSPWSTAHLHGMHSYEIDHSSSDFSSSLCCIPCYAAYSSSRYARARDKSRQGHSRDVGNLPRRKLVPVMTTYLPAATPPLHRDMPQVLPVHGPSRIRLSFSFYERSSFAIRRFRCFEE